MEGATTCLPPPTRSSSLLDEGQSWVLGVLLSNVTHCFCQGSPETTPKASSATSSGLQSWGTGGRDGNKTGKEERWWKSSSPSCSLLGALTTSADLLGHLEIWRRCVLFRRSKKREESDPLPSELGHLCRKFPGSSGLRVPLWPTSRLYVSRASWRQEVWAPADRSSGEGLWARWGHLQLAICGPGTARSRRVGGARLVCGGIHGARVDTLGVPLPREPPCTGVGPRAPAHLIFKSTDTGDYKKEAKYSQMPDFKVTHPTVIFLYRQSWGSGPRLYSDSSRWRAMPGVPWDSSRRSHFPINKVYKLSVCLAWGRKATFVLQGLGI